MGASRNSQQRRPGDGDDADAFVSEDDLRNGVAPEAPTHRRVPVRPAAAALVVVAVLAIVWSIGHWPAREAPVLPAVRVFTTPLKPATAPAVEPAKVATTGSRPQAPPRAVVATRIPPLPVIERRPAAAMTETPSLEAPRVAESEPDEPVPVTMESVSIVAHARDRAETTQVLRSYQDSYNRMDTASIARMWPTVDTGALSRAFGTLAAQRLELDSCDLDFQSMRATAKCTGTLRYVPRVGDPTPRVVRKVWTIELQRAADQWQIAAVAVR
jgi:hypothetical protein